MPRLHLAGGDANGGLPSVVLAAYGNTGPLAGKILGHFLTGEMKGDRIPANHQYRRPVGEAGWRLNARFDSGNCGNPLGNEIQLGQPALPLAS